MAGTFKNALHCATKDFNRHVKPFLLALWIGCEIFSCEEQQDPLLRALDNYAGIDYLILREDVQQVIGLASRIQRTGLNYQTFTIRKARDNGSPTEYEKRITAIAGGRLFPALTLQAYLSTDGEQLLQMGLANTVDLFNFIRRNPSEQKHTNENQRGQASFFAVKWSDFERHYSLMTAKPADEPNAWIVSRTGTQKKLLRS